MSQDTELSTKPDSDQWSKQETSLLMTVFAAAMAGFLVLYAVNQIKQRTAAIEQQDAESFDAEQAFSESRNDRSAAVMPVYTPPPYQEIRQ